MLPEKDQEKKFSLIPKNTDVLICHGPPYGILDTVRRRQQEFPSNTYYEKLGSHALAKALGRVRPKVAAWGHIHDAYGQKTIGETTYINASLLDEGYNLVNKPVIFEL
jgi:Icc-related predicted phosphoesterase